MRFVPASFAAAAGLLAAVTAVLHTPSAHSRQLSADGIQRPLPHAGDRKTVTRTLSAECRGVVLHTSDNVVIRQGKEASLTLTGPAEELERTSTVVEKGRLLITKTGNGKMNWTKGEGVTITITLPTIESLAVNGSGDLKSDGTLTGAELAISVAGSGDVQVAAELTGALSTKLAGSGDVRLSGRCASHTVSVAGSGDVRADALKASSATVKLSGSGDVSVAAADALDVSISGSGDVRYAGAPKQLVKRVTGSGSVARL